MTGHYAEYEEMWNEMGCREIPFPKVQHHVTAQPFIAQLEYLMELSHGSGITAFGDAIVEIRGLMLIGKDGQWRDRWRNEYEADPQRTEDRLAVDLVAQLIRDGATETDAVAHAVWDRELPGANFKAAWSRLRALYYETYPDRPRRKRGRPRGS